MSSRQSVDIFFLLAILCVSFAVEGKKKGAYPKKLEGCPVPYPCDVHMEKCTSIPAQPDNPDDYIETTTDLLGRDHAIQVMRSRMNNKGPAKWNHQLYRGCYYVDATDSCYETAVFKSREECQEKCQCGPDDGKAIMWKEDKKP